MLQYLTACAFVAALVAGCATEPVDGVGGEGRLALSTSFAGVTRAVTPAAYTVNIGTARGYTHMFDQTDVPSELWLAAGSYFIEVEAGARPDEISWSAPAGGYYYKEKQEFGITGGGTTALDVICRPRNTMLTVSFESSVPAMLDDYEVKFYLDKAKTKSVVFDAGKDGATAHLMLPEGETQVPWEFTAWNDDYQIDVEKTGTVTLAPGKDYDLEFKYTFAAKLGGMNFSVVVDQSSKDIGRDIVIYQRPRIMGVDQYGAQEPVDGLAVTVQAAVGDITAIAFSGEVFGTDYDVLSAGNMASYGITRAAAAGGGYEFTFGWQFFKQMAGAHPPGEECGIIIKATDTNGRVNEVYFRLSTEVTAGRIARADMWAKHAYVTGVALQGGEVKFAYRKTADAEWQYTAVQTGEDGKYALTLAGLSPGTEYETCIVYNGEHAGQVRKFVTEAAPQLYNGGFEQWNQDGSKVWYANASGTKYWDSGNKGSVTAPVIGKEGNNNNTRQEDPRPGSAGSYSARMDSEWFGFMGQGAFAAGSMYTGEFLEARADASNPSGRVSFGRPFAGRPSALSVWYKAASGTVDYAKDNAPLSKGQTDRYQIYIALADSGFPREVDTANWSNLVKYDTDPGIIAYGEIVSSASVGSWTQVTIPLTYRSYDRIPTHVVAVASASMYGDYFTGSTDSWLCVDDMELVYDQNVSFK